MKRFSKMCLIVLMPLLASCGDGENAPPDIAHLAADGYFVVGGTLIQAPFVAVESVTTDGAYLSQRKRNDQKKFQELATSADTPLKVNQIEFYLSSYGTYGEYGVSAGICPRLSQEWAVSICHNKKRGKLEDLPKTFLLLDRKAVPHLLKQRMTVGQERVSDQVSKMKLLIGEPESVCDKDSKFCTAAVAISAELVAVWSEGATGVSDEGQAIYWLVTNAIARPT
ncbi:hypothetical protein [Rhizobium binae]|uniref:hypothetical protein n=1 Tax=Rhizobium binae TaxID=1138190 RepID=UPI003DA86FA9